MSLGTKRDLGIYLVRRIPRDASSLRLTFEMRSVNRPSYDEIGEAQIAKGFNPYFHGGPWNVKQYRTCGGADGVEVTTWECSRKSD